MTRLITSDMDDTFLADDKSVPSTNRHMLDVMDKTDILFVPRTGRMLSGIPEEVISHPCVRYAICSDGAYVVKFDEEETKVLFRGGIDKERVLELYRCVRGLDI